MKTWRVRHEYIRGGVSGTKVYPAASQLAGFLRFWWIWLMQLGDLDEVVLEYRGGP